MKKFLSRVKNKTFYKLPPDDFGRITSYPFISGDTFLSIADAIVVKQKKQPLLIEITNKKKIIFIENDLLSIEWVFDFAKGFKKIILHNYPIPPDMSLLNQLANKKIHIFGTNIQLLNKYIEPIPLGLENAYKKNNGDTSYYNLINIEKKNKFKNNILLVSFSVQTNPEIRKNYESILKKYKYKNKYYKNKNAYKDILSRSYFVVSPPGFGIDCHRTWEALIHKTVPIIERKYYLFAHIDLPILVVENISQFLEYDDEEKIEIYNSIIQKSFEKVYMHWWIDHILNK